MHVADKPSSHMTGSQRVARDVALACSMVSFVVSFMVSACVKSSVEGDITKQASVSSASLTQVLPAGVTARWEVAAGDFSGFAIDYMDGSFERDLTVKVRLLGVPPQALYISGNQTLITPLLITLPDIIIPSGSSLTANLSSIGVSFLDDATGKITQLTPTAAGLASGKLQVPIKTFGTLMTGTGSDPAEISDLKSQIEQLKNSSTGIAASSFFITAPLAPVAASSTTVTWQAATGAATYTLKIASDVTCNTITQTFAGLTATSKSLSGLSSGLSYLCLSAADAAGTTKQATNNGLELRVDINPPTVPGIPSSPQAIVATNALTFSWTGSTDSGPGGLASYDLQVGTTAGASDIFNATVGTSLSKTITSLSDGLYYARVRAVDALGNTSNWSASSTAVRIDSTPPTAATALITAASGATGADVRLATPTGHWLAWTAGTDNGSGIRDYTITEYLSPTCSGTGTDIFTGIAAISKALTGTNGTVYSYKVKTFDNAGNVSTSACSGSLTVRTRSHMLFATSGVWNGNLGGLSGADAKCQAAATAAGLSTLLPWRALLSTSAVNASSRVMIKGPVYRADGTTLIANNYSDLWDGSLANAIRTETNGVPASPVWTGSNINGGIKGFGFICNEWQTITGSGQYGNASVTDSDWISVSNTYCSTASHGLYCINEYAGQPLTAFNAVTGSTTNGTIDMTINFPTNTTYYGRVDIRRIAGATAPNADCATDGTVVKSFTTFSNATWTDTTPLAGGLYSYRACVYDDDLIFVGSLSMTKTGVYSKGSYHLMFATSTIYQGNFGGLSAADSICAARAAAGDLSGTWIALLSTSTIDAKDRIYEDGPFYNVLGQLVANNETDLWDGAIASTLIADEFKGTGNSVLEIYSGSTQSGVVAYTCGDWTSNSASAYSSIGSLNQTSSWWINTTGANQYCAPYRRLLCISHATTPNLSAFTAATGTTTDGDVTLTLTYPGDTSNYGRVDIRRLAEATAPSKDCTTNGTLVTSITNMSTTTYTDATGATGRQFTYRACVYDLAGNLVATLPSSPAFAKGARHTIFFTNASTFTGNLGGLSGADASCTSAANTVGLTGSWKAMLSITGVHAKDRIAWAGPIYNTANLLVASSAAAFFASSWNNLMRDEFGSLGNGSSTWTGSYANGTLGSQTCSDWTSNSGGYGWHGYDGWSFSASGGTLCIYGLKLVCAQ